MKKRILALATVAWMVTAAAAAFTCQCAFAGCELSGRTVDPKAPQCHHESAPDKEQGPCERCCGKCRVEKAAVVFEKPLCFANARSNFTSDETARVGGGSGRTNEPSRLNAGLHGPPGTFFILHAFGSSLAFRAPPQR